jgi:hypothetical protein
MGTLVEEVVKKFVKKLVDKKCYRKILHIQFHANEVLPSYVGNFAKLCMESCQAM